MLEVTGKYLERARSISEKSDLSCGLMTYSIEFLKTYIDYLSKSGQKAEIAEWQKDKQSSPNRDTTAGACAKRLSPASRCCPA
jgi:hypothetical protein